MSQKNVNINGKIILVFVCISFLKLLIFHGCDIVGIYFAFSTFSTTLSKLFENISFLDNSLNSKTCSSIATNKSPLKAFITRHSVLDEKHFNSLLIYG